ncbi:hypothetical protein MKW94_009290 [Papaver nudicaule]|uniref:Serine incorporator n=1 Tax=Papaver nudicaule TaxID=74823 RepID=A0AA42B2J1_PAPNU|nr:hypothetical protein [Papaver nudicaule]
MSARIDREEAPIATVKCKSNTLEYSAERRKSLRARYIYGSIFLLMNLMTWFIRDYGHNIFHNDLCKSMFRLTLNFALHIFALHIFVRYCGSEGGDCKMGVLRIICLADYNLSGSIFLPSVLDSLVRYCHLFSGELARLGAGFFLLVQLVSVIQVITLWNNYWMSDATLNGSCFLGIFMSIVFYIGSVCGIALMYLLYAPTLSCTVNISVISWTVVLIVAMLVVTIHSKVRCILSSGIMASYIVYLCWSAIRSEPTNKKCSPEFEGSGNGDWTTVLGFLIAICAIVMATFSTGIDSQSFQFQKDEVQHAEDIPYTYEIFHMVFSLGSMYFAMLFISWQLQDHPSKRWSIDVGSASTWVKIINETFAATIYLWKMVLPVARKNKVMDDQDKPMNNSTKTIFILTTTTT